MHGPSIMNMPILPSTIHVDYSKMSGIFYGYDWLSRSEYESRKSIIENNVAQFLYFTTPTNKGTMHTLNMLVNSVSDEERAAIWIYSFAKEVSERNNSSSISRYTYELCDASEDFHSQNFYMWHHAMKKLVPEIFILRSLYAETKFNTIDAAIELARLNAAIVLQEYVPILYSSLEHDEKAPNISVRRE